MSAEVINQGIFWLSCFITGAVITFIYDQIRIVRRVLPHGSVLVAIEDLLFWFFAAIVIFSLLYRMNAGTLRWFAVLGAAVGIFLYGRLISALYLKLAVKLLAPIKVFLKRILTGIWKLLKMLGKGVMRHVRSIFKRKEHKGASRIFKQKKSGGEQAEPSEAQEGILPKEAGK